MNVPSPEGGGLEAVTKPEPSVSAWQPMPIEVLPEPLRSYITQAASSVSCDTSFVATPLITSAAAAIGMSRRVRLKHDWTEPCIIWTAIVGPSGDGKSPALDKALAFASAMHDETLRRQEDARAQHEVDMQRYQKKLAAWKRIDDDTDPPREPEPPLIRRVLASDTTVEALVVILQANPRGVLLFCDELSGWFLAFNQYKGGSGSDESHWLQMNGGRPLTVDRKGTGTLHARVAAVSITGGVQPGVLQRLLVQERYESGMAARIHFVSPPTRARLWSEGSIKSATRAEVADVFKGLYELNPADASDDNYTPLELSLSPDAREAFIAFYNESELERPDLPAPLAAASAKIVGLAGRLAIVLHCVRQVSQGVEAPDIVDTESMEAAITLAKWFRREGRRVYEVLQQTDEEAQLRKLVDWIAVKGPCTAREAHRFNQRRYTSSNDALHDLTGLVNAGTLEEIPAPPTSQGGRPTVRFGVKMGTACDKTPRSTSRAEARFGLVPVGGWRADLTFEPKAHRHDSIRGGFGVLSEGVSLWNR